MLKWGEKEAGRISPFFKHYSFRFQRSAFACKDMKLRQLLSFGICVTWRFSRASTLLIIKYKRPPWIIRIGTTQRGLIQPQGGKFNSSTAVTQNELAAPIAVSVQAFDLRHNRGILFLVAVETVVPCASGPRHLPHLSCILLTPGCKDQHFHPHSSKLLDRSLQDKKQRQNETRRPSAPRGVNSNVELLPFVIRKGSYSILIGVRRNVTSWKRRRNNVFGFGTTVQLCRTRCYGECSQHHWYGVVQEATLRGRNEITTELSCNPGFTTEHHNSVEGERGRGYKRAYTALNSPLWAACLQPRNACFCTALTQRR